MFWRTVGRWAILVVAVPVAAWGLRKVTDKLEAKHGATKFSSVLRQGAGALDTISGHRRHEASAASRR